jgi:1-acyl-sn-glycerol-3-phosphate acyltransferase
VPIWRDPDVEERVGRLELPFNAHGVDPYGATRKDLVWFFSLIGWFYKHYFDVRVTGAEHVPARGRGMLIGNHSGGVAIDGGMVLCSMIFEKDPPRLAHAMAEKFLPAVPFFGKWISRAGHLTGLPEHAVRLLEDERLLMVFPEGARGTAKLYWESDSLVDFGGGFMRLALQTRTPIIPFGFVGAGAAFPTVMNLYKLGKLVGAPYIPVTAYLAPIPRRVPFEIVYGEPMRFEGKHDDDDEVIDAKVDQVKARVAELIKEGRGRLG